MRDILILYLFVLFLTYDTEIALSPFQIISHFEIYRFVYLYIVYI
jgi:hypothetical protein